MQMNTQTSPIFIHSLFRSGSTYLFNVFRRSACNYTAYYEPLHPALVFLATDPEKVLAYHHNTAAALRHPSLDKPYFYEFFVVADRVGPLFSKAFPYDEYFVSDRDDYSDLKRYFMALIEGSKGRPVFQCCRSTGRVEGFRAACGGTHVFLWRNPWDQWWSYRLGFDVHNLFIANAVRPPAFLTHIKQALDLPETHDSDIFVEYAYYDRYAMDSLQSYTLFYALWCHAMLEAMPCCQVSINIDRLTNSSEYRENILTQLGLFAASGLDFADCNIPQGIYAKCDREFFLDVEDNVHSLLVRSGYSSESIERIKQIRYENSPVPEPTRMQDFAIRDGSRAREIVRHYENKLHDAYLTEKKYVGALLAKDAERHVLNDYLKESQAAATKLQEKLTNLQEELTRITESRMYKIGKKLRLI